MGFSPTIKQQVLNDTARHCCVCHRYKGIKIEIHHLEQEADGGSNTYENAIPLCFDCHSDAGHYNDRHPKGTKFSISELRKARDNWYQFVKEKSIVEKLIISNHIHTSYYVLHSFDILDSVLKGDFTSINNNRKRVFLLSNTISKRWEMLLESHNKDFGYSVEQQMLVETQHFNTIDDYCKTYDGVKVIDKSTTEYPYYEAIRKPNWSDLLSIVESNLFITHLSNSGIDAEQFCTCILYKNGDGCDCAEAEFEYTEYLEIAPISFLFLGITNTSKEQIKLNQLLVKESTDINLPNFNLLPSEMVLIPIASAINLQEIVIGSTLLEHIDGERGQDFSRVFNGEEFDENNVVFFKDKINPVSVVYNDNNGEYEVEIHELDFNNLYSMNSYWQCGSCPHLFYKKENGQQEYVRELLVSSSFKPGTDEIIVPADIFELIIRELEDEVTYIDKIFINNRLIYESIILEKGNSLTFQVSPYDHIVIEGRYEPNYPSYPKTNDIWRRNEIIKESNKRFNLL